jgi:hypothetical protein
MDHSERESQITLAQPHQYQEESPDERNTRLKEEAKNQPALIDYTKPKKWWEQNIVRVAAVSTALGLATIAAWVSCDGKTPTIVPPPTPSPIPPLRPTEIPTILPTATATPFTPETPTQVPTATEQPKWQPHFSEDTTLKHGETFWSNSYDKAVAYLQTYYGDKYFKEEADTPQLTEEGERVDEVMADGSTLIVLVENNISLERAKNLSDDLIYQGPSTDTMTIMYEGVIGQPENNLVDPNEPYQFVNLAQKVDFNGEQLTDAEITAAQHLLVNLNTLEEAR